MAVSTKPPLGAVSTIAKGVFNCELKSVCAAPVTATPAVAVVMLGNVSPFALVKLKVPVPPLDTFAIARVVGLAVLVNVQVNKSPGAGVIEKLEVARALGNEPAGVAPGPE